MGKRLQIDYINIKKALWGDETKINNGVLTINREELYALAQSDLFRTLDIYLIAPGEQVRVVCVNDCTQPRVKADHPEQSFPGIWGELAPAGEGRTVALRGMIVSETYNMRTNLSHVLDMSGNAAQYSHFSKQFHIVIDAQPNEGVSGESYAMAMKHACLSICVHLASAGISIPPDETEIFELTPVASDPNGNHLPKVAYIVNELATFDTWQFFVYGESAIGMLPIILHPNEILDGAMVRRYWIDANYYVQNESVIRELYRRHGVDIDFLGVVISNNQMSLESKERFAMMCALLAKDTLHADAVISNKSGMVHGQLDASFQFLWSEKLGMPSVVHLNNASNYKPADTLLVSDPKVDAILSGTHEFMIDFPEMERVIGTSQVPSLIGINQKGPFRAKASVLKGVMSQTGEFYLTIDTEIKNP